MFLAVGTGLVVHARRALLRELRQARRVVGAARSVLPHPLPPRLDGLGLAAAQLSADPGATAGGDLYEAIATEHGVRVVIGDVRGHGLPAAGTAAAVLGSFREAAHDEPRLDGVLRRLERAHARRSREPEEFVTVLLLEIGADGGLRHLNCGHPWPYRLGPHGVEPLAQAEPLPPLGPFPLPHDLRAAPGGRLRRGESLVLHTDGVEDARDGHGTFFDLAAVLTRVVREQPVTPHTVLCKVFTALLRHTDGSPKDDVAVLVLRNERRREDTADTRGNDTPLALRP